MINGKDEVIENYLEDMERLSGDYIAQNKRIDKYKKEMKEIDESEITIRCSAPVLEETEVEIEFDSGSYYRHHYGRLIYRKGDYNNPWMERSKDTNNWINPITEDTVNYMHDYVLMAIITPTRIDEIVEEGEKILIILKSGNIKK